MRAQSMKRACMAALTIAMVLGATVSFAQTDKMVPKVDNFVFFTDQSGSMYMNYAGTDTMKMTMVKDFLVQVAERIPELNYDGSLVLFAPEKVMLSSSLYKASTFQNAAGTIEDKQRIFGRQTPMGPDLKWLEGTMPPVADRFAIIVVSDGKANVGQDPVEVARQIKSVRPNACFHVVSFADDQEGQQTLDEIHALSGNCGVTVDGRQLMADDTAMRRFVADVFYGREAVVAQVEPAPQVQEVIVLRGIQFDFDKSDIKPEWGPVLNEAAQILRDNPNIDVVVAGHTDAIGTVAYNQDLSERRARAVYSYLLDRGIGADRMKMASEGETHPIATNDTAEGRALNRRTEFEVTQQVASK